MVDQSYSSNDTVAKILEISGECRHKDSVLHEPPEKKSHGFKSGERGGHCINASSSFLVRLIYLCVKFRLRYRWKQVQPSGILLEIVAAQSQRTKFLPLPKHKMTAHVYWMPYLLLLPPSGKLGQLCARAFPYEKTWRVSLSIGVRITMIRCVVYLLRIFKMFHGHMNNPVRYNRAYHIH
jgi:hypothetical protein